VHRLLRKKQETMKKSGEEKTGKDEITEKLYQEAQKTDDDPTYSITPSFNWAEDIDASDHTT
jgi:hypothetical protein